MGVLNHRVSAVEQHRIADMDEHEFEESPEDLVKHGNSADQRDMARMGKIQEMRVRDIYECAIGSIVLTSRKAQFQDTHYVWFQYYFDVFMGVSSEVRWSCLLKSSIHDCGRLTRTTVPPPLP